MIRGAATNHDGRSSGLTVPNGTAQQAVIRKALDDALLSPLDVDAIEAHGTGTELGDPIEVRALHAVYSAGRSTDRPLQLGSVKTNIGHLEAAAGLTGLLKMVLALQHGALPAQLHCDEPSPHIDWANMPIEVLRQEVPWVSDASARRAAISSFGFSGTNAHVIVEEAPPRARRNDRADAPVRVDHTLRQVLSGPRRAWRPVAPIISRSTQTSSSDVATITNTGRARFAHRLAIAATSSADAVRRLREWVAISDDLAVAGVGQGIATLQFAPRRIRVHRPRSSVRGHGPSALRR